MILRSIYARALDTRRRGSAGPTTYVVPNNDAAAAFLSTTNVAWDATRGYYINAATWGTGRSLSLPFSPSLIKKITANFTCYYNTPSNCLGLAWISWTLDDSTNALMGIADAHADAFQGQTLYRGDAGNTGLTQTNVVNQVWTYTVPSGRFINTPISFVGDYLSGHPACNRGIKDITFYL